MTSFQHIMQEANTHARAGRFADAAACLEDAVQLAPNNAGVWVSLGMMRSTGGDLDGAEAALRRGAELDARNVDARLCLGILLANLQRTREADAAFREALDLAPMRVDISHAYSRILAETARSEEALAIIRAAQKHSPGDVSLQDKVCCLVNYISGMDADAVFAEHVKFGRMVGDPAPMHGVSDRSPDRKLRIGYLSGDLREHSVAYFIEPVLEHHDRSRFEVWCYHVGAPDEKASPRLRARADQWRHIFPSTDDVLCAAIAGDRIDILVELAGHAQGNRLPAVARRVAPVNVTYIGYPNTTGVPAIGYRIVDERTDPAGAEKWATERLVRLGGAQGCFLCYRPYDGAPAVEERRPGQVGGTSRVTFGSFNNLAKMSAQTLDLWGRVMARVPGSRLMLKGRGLGDDTVRDRVLSRLAGAGITADRVELAGHTKTTPEHLALYHQIDIALDPFPYCGTTTTCEAMWMGVPVVTLAGVVHAGRVGVSLLETVGLPELVARSEEEYVSVAAELAGDAPRLAHIRSTLRQRMRASPLCDGAAYTRRLEAAYRSMWTEWCATPSPRAGLGRFFGR